MHGLLRWRRRSSRICRRSDDEHEQSALMYHQCPLTANACERRVLRVQGTDRSWPQRVFRRHAPIALPRIYASLAAHRLAHSDHLDASLRPSRAGRLPCRVDRAALSAKGVGGPPLSSARRACRSESAAVVLVEVASAIVSTPRARRDSHAWRAVARLVRRRDDDSTKSTPFCLTSTTLGGLPVAPRLTEANAAFARLRDWNAGIRSAALTPDCAIARVLAPRRDRSRQI